MVYREIQESKFDGELVEALASGVGPDAVVISHDLVTKHSNKIFPIPFTTFSERNFSDTFIGEASLLYSSLGFLGIPIGVDPLIMYWNRDMFASAGVSMPPRYWDEVLKVVPYLSEKDSSVNISRSAIALGDFGNINNAKEIISSMALQSGLSIVSVGSTGA